MSAQTQGVGEKRVCSTCRYWDVHSTKQSVGSCRAPNNHRYSRVLITGKRPDGSEHHSYAMLDSFGPEETLPGFTCGVWDDGQAAGATGAAS